jgi:hypothetical protein
MTRTSWARFTGSGMHTSSTSRDSSSSPARQQEMEGPWCPLTWAHRPPMQNSIHSYHIPIPIIPIIVIVTVIVAEGCSWPEGQEVNPPSPIQRPIIPIPFQRLFRIIIESLRQEDSSRHTPLPRITAGQPPLPSTLMSTIDTLPHTAPVRVHRLFSNDKK